MPPRLQLPETLSGSAGLSAFIPAVAWIRFSWPLTPAGNDPPAPHPIARNASTRKRVLFSAMPVFFVDPAHPMSDTSHTSTLPITQRESRRSVKLVNYSVYRLLLFHNAGPGDDMMQFRYARAAVGTGLKYRAYGFRGLQIVRANRLDDGI